MVKKFAIGIMAVVSFTLIFCSCVNDSPIETTIEETTTITPTPILTPSPTPTPIPAPVKQARVSEPSFTYSEGYTYYLTNYCACTYCCGPNAQGICADGTPVSDSWINHSVAADSSIPFGTRFIIPELSGNVIYTVHDRGSAVNGAHFDIFQSSHQTACESPSGYYTVYFID